MKTLNTIQQVILGTLHILEIFTNNIRHNQALQLLPWAAEVNNTTTYRVLTQIY